MKRITFKILVPYGYSYSVINDTLKLFCKRKNYQIIILSPTVSLKGWVANVTLEVNDDNPDSNSEIARKILQFVNDYGDIELMTNT